MWAIASEETERLVVGACLVHASAFDDASGEVQPDDFSIPPLRAAWSAIVAVDQAHNPIDVVSVWLQMQVDGSAALVSKHGGAAFLERLMSGVVTVENIGYHAKTLARLAERRRWETELRELSARARDESCDSHEFFSDVEGRLLQMLMQRKTTSSLLGARAAMKQLTADIEQRFEDKDKLIMRGVPTGFWHYDGVTGGHQAGNLIIWAARPNVGKSALAGNAVEYAAMKKIPQLIFSLEMGGLELYERMIAANGIKADALRTGHMTRDDHVSMTRTAGRLAEPERIWIDDQVDLTITEIRSRARRWRSRAGAGKHAQIVVDYLQLVRTGRRGGNVSEAEEVAEASRGLKALAKELACPVLALAQLNREVDKRANKRPTLVDLRSSGQMEQDADIVAFLYREEIADPDCSYEHKGTAELVIAKGRGIPRANVKLSFDGETTKFSNRKDT